MGSEEEGEYDELAFKDIDDTIYTDVGRIGVLCLVLLMLLVLVLMGSCISDVWSSSRLYLVGPCLAML